MIRLLAVPLLFLAAQAIFPNRCPASTVTAGGRESRRVEEILSGLSDEEKVGQLMMVGFGGKEMGPEIARFLLDLHVGSITLYSRNIDDNDQLARLVHEVRRVMKDEVQPFLALDQEGGNVVRVRTDVAVLPGAMALGATRDPVLAFLAGQANAVDLGILGFDMNLAPVLDINKNPKNPVINIRAFGDHPGLVAEMGAWLIQGQQQADMATVAKHFPGHGTTDRDSHYALPSIDLSAEQLRGSELLPFRKAIREGLDAVMTAHVRVPAIAKDGTPASLSRPVITGLLREEMGFDGVVITDDLEMRAIVDNQDVGDAAVQAILAGADVVMVIWTPERKRRVQQALLDAVRSGKIPAQRLDASVRRILMLKARRGTLDAWPRTRTRLSELLPNPLHTRLINTIAQRAITLVRNRDGLLPVCSGKGVLVAGPQKTFAAELHRLLPETSIVHLRRVPSRAQRERDLKRLAALADEHRVVILSVVNAYQAWLAQRLRHRTRTPLAVVSFGSPYFLRNFPGADAYLCTYSYLDTVEKAAARAVAGRTSITGRLPVSINQKFRRGHGLVIPTRACATAASR